jgi:hypothetical protein
MQFKNYFFALLLLLSACIKPEELPDVIRLGYRPIYADAQALRNIQQQASRPIQHLGNILVLDSLLLMVELNRGIHFYQNSDPNNPIPLTFLSIPGTSNLWVQDGYLYADNFSDLVVFDLSNLQNIQVVNRLSNYFPQASLLRPPYPTIYFECADLSLGYPIDWVQDSLVSPQCRSAQ